MVSVQTSRLFLHELLRIHFRTFVFLIYINDLSDGLKSNAKFFADNNSLFSVVKNKEKKANDLTNDLMTLIRFPNRHITGECHSVQTL